MCYRNSKLYLPHVTKGYQELSKYIRTYCYISARNVSLRTLNTFAILRVHISTIKGRSRFNVRRPIRCIYLPLQPGSRYGPFTPGGIHKSNGGETKEKEERGGGGGECLARRCQSLLSCLFTRPANSSSSHLLSFSGR